MTSVRISFFQSSLRFALKLLVCVLGAGTILLANALAQGARGGPQEPSVPAVPSVPAIDPAPIAALFQNPIPADQLAFLSSYAGRPAKEAMKDKRFDKLLKLTIPRTEYHYGRDMPLWEASDAVIGGSKLPVEIREGRYVTISGAKGEYLNGRGFLWFDLQTGIAVGGVYFHPVNGEPTPTLAIFSKQLKQTSLSLNELPQAFVDDLETWSSKMSILSPTVRYFIPESGKKYVLVHDEDYCDPPPSLPAAHADLCQQLNAEAADADVNAAYFMSQTHNAANATAWMLGPDQMEWINVRDQTCGLGPGGLGCRIRITRQRTRVLLH